MGRAIRHAADFAALFFVDARYERGGATAASLPAWMAGRMQTTCLADLPQTLERFYAPLIDEHAQTAIGETAN